MSKSKFSKIPVVTRIISVRRNGRIKSPGDNNSIFVGNGDLIYVDALSDVSGDSHPQRKHHTAFRIFVHQPPRDAKDDRQQIYFEEPVVSKRNRILYGEVMHLRNPIVECMQHGEIIELVAVRTLRDTDLREIDDATVVEEKAVEDTASSNVAKALPISFGIVCRSRLDGFCIDAVEIMSISSDGTKHIGGEISLIKSAATIGDAWRRLKTAYQSGNLDRLLAAIRVEIKVALDGYECDSESNSDKTTTGYKKRIVYRVIRPTHNETKRQIVAYGFGGKMGLTDREPTIVLIEQSHGYLDAWDRLNDKYEARKFAGTAYERHIQNALIEWKAKITPPEVAGDSVESKTEKESKTAEEIAMPRKYGCAADYAMSDIRKAWPTANLEYIGGYGYFVVVYQGDEILMKGEPADSEAAAWMKFYDEHI